MVERRVVRLLLLVLVCLVGFSPFLHATSQYESRTRRRVREQQEENKDWKREAARTESALVRVAHKYYKTKEYRWSAKYYRKALAVRYQQWAFKEVKSGSMTTIRPAREKKWHKLDTNNTRTARDRLRSMEDVIERQKQKEEERNLKRMFEEAEVATMLRKDARAYEVYGKIIEAAEEIGEKKYAIQNAVKARDKRRAIIKKMAKPLDDLEGLIKKKKPSEALDKLEEYERTHEDVMKVIPELAERCKEMRRSPFLRAEHRERTVKRRIQMGDAALLREDYLHAHRWYRKAATIYPDTASGKVAAEKLVRLLQDPKASRALKERAMEADCRPLLVRAKGLIEEKEYDRARVILEEIAEKYPDTAWSKKAEALLAAIKEGGAETK